MQTTELICAAKRSSGLPIRSLARAGGVAGSTITRIQSGDVDPSIHTLERILGAADLDLRLEIARRGAPHRPRLGDLVDAWSIRDGRLRLRWTRFRALLDHLALHPELIPEAIYPAPSPTGEKAIDALLAAIAEKLADDAELARPLWAEDVPALEDEYRPPLPRSTANCTIPEQLRERGLMIDTGSLWREPSTVGV